MRRPPAKVAPPWGAFYEADPDDQGQFHGAVLSGPGLLGFSHPYKPGDEFRADRKPMVSFPDGKQNIKLPPPSNTGAYRTGPDHLRSAPVDRAPAGPVRRRDPDRPP